ncbi:hypothetical protein [Prevotella sp.]
MEELKLEYFRPTLSPHFVGEDNTHFLFKVATLFSQQASVPNG